MILKDLEKHCALYFDGGLYDITGRVSAKNYVVAGEKELNFMKKNYIPGFNRHKVLQYLEQNL